MAYEPETILTENSLLDFRRILKGLASPRDSGEHKLALMALTRIFGPSAIALLLSVGVLVSLLVLVARTSVIQGPTVEVTVMEPETTELEDIKEIIKEFEVEPLEPPPLDNLTAFTDVPYEAPPAETPVVSDTAVELAAPVPLLTKSPLIIKNLYGNRMSASARQGAMRAYRGSAKGEDAVLRALRWLKKKQDPDGSWKTASTVDHVAMTGLALLTFLAHGETPQSEEFGPTVEKAMQWLIAHQAKDAKGKFSQNSYTHAICAYAVSEAYALTKIMAVRDSMEKAITFLIDGQQDQGGYDYVYKKGDRFDVSVAGWNFQALKAASMAGSNEPRLEEAIRKAVMFLKTQAYAQNGSGFVYSGTPGQPSAGGGKWTMTGVGTLCLQLLGHARDPETRQGLVAMEPLTCVWPTGDGKPNVYGWYYVTQAKFQAGESTFNPWNAQFSKEFVDNQIREDDGCGYWPVGDHGGPVYATTLATLSLEVYYRYLPTYKKAEEVETVTATATDDVEIEIL